ncbi:MAG: aldo/keto reductase [Armatimonadetes bacterium]|nr:aldo/keto reductase [Candidatus Hippobium faecium]
MIYRQFKDLSLSLLGFGCMRFPMKDEQIDEAEVGRMVEYAIENGVNYFDTAYPYHDGLSELIISKELKKYPKDKWFLATKYPGHQIAETYYPEEIFEEQLRKCQTDCFDFYLLHNIYENSYKTYTDPKWKIAEYFVKQKEKGRIKHLGFSCHADSEMMKNFLDIFGDVMEFCQVQLNYLDWTLQKGKEKYNILEERNIPCWVMEPLRGGKLANLPENLTDKLKETCSDMSPAEQSFRFLISLTNIKMILSGMSSLDQMKDNIRIFSTEKPFTEKDSSLLLSAAEKMKDNIPCTGCGYCRKMCPMELNIPHLLEKYNDLKFDPTFTVSMQIEAMPENRQPSACIKCGKCKTQCPQLIDIPSCFADFSEKLKTLPKWSVMCKERAEAAKKLKN